MDRPIIMPFLRKRVGQNRLETLGGERGYPNGANIFPAFSLVVLAGGLLAAVATDGVLCLGQTPDESKASPNPDPPKALFGDRHWPFNLDRSLLLMNISNDANAVGQANGAPQLSAVTIGGVYGITRPTTGPYAGFQFVNVQETTATLFQVIEKPAMVENIPQDENTYNGIVLVRVIEAKLQLLGS